ncbi:NUDIX hydrolase [Microlunatus sp. GCM10028923]|uniref:NUDIX hydrolase n=1 Tax=Microlunatus sp. GCM10028923 TaxID=3273400 RepID=UPI0036211542
MAAASAQLVVSGLVRCGDSLVVVENSSPQGLRWSAPGGKVEPGETPAETVAYFDGLGLGAA